MLVNNYDVLWAGGLELQNKPVDLKKMYVRFLKEMSNFQENPQYLSLITASNNGVIRT